MDEKVFQLEFENILLKRALIEIQMELNTLPKKISDNDLNSLCTIINKVQAILTLAKGCLEDLEEEESSE